MATRLEPILIKYATDDLGQFCIQWDRMSLKRKGFIADRAHASEPWLLGWFEEDWATEVILRNLVDGRVKWREQEINGKSYSQPRLIHISITISFA
jgi:hypothetical protein